MCTRAAVSDEIAKCAVAILSHPWQPLFSDRLSETNSRHRNNCLIPNQTEIFRVPLRTEFFKI